VELSENVPVAVNCSVVPRGRPEFAGVTAIDTSIGGGLIIMFSTVTVPLLTVSVPLITEFELSVEKMLSYPPIRVNVKLL
jgi:hypothetical protein